MRPAIRSEAAAQLAIAAPLQERARIAAAWCNIKPAPRRTIMQAPRPASIYRATLAAALAGFATVVARNRALAAVMVFDPDVHRILQLQPDWGDLIVRQLTLLTQLDEGATGDDRAFYEGKIASASFFAKNMLPLLTSVRAVIESIDNETMELDEASF